MIYVLLQACLTNADPCTCFASVQIPAASSNCNPGTIQTEAKAILKSCKSAFSACSKGLKEAGAYVDQCKCDCMTMTTLAPDRAVKILSVLDTSIGIQLQIKNKHIKIKCNNH